MNGFLRDLKMTTKTDTSTGWSARLRWSGCVGSLAMLVACGGGGGAAPPVPRFESVSVAGVAGVRDNTTGHIWAAQPGADKGSIQPKAQELLDLVDLGAGEWGTYFGPALGQSLQAAESVPNSLWVVDFGRINAGRLSNEAVAPNPNEPYLQWRMLSRAAQVTYSLVLESNGTVIQGTSLVWSLCTEPMTYQNGRCVGTPRPYSLAQAQERAAQSTLGAYSGWRLPTKQELQDLLRLESTGNTLQPSLLPEPFASHDAFEALIGLVPLQYLSSSRYNRAPQPEQLWAVDFSVGEDPGGVEPINNDGFALVRLVRNR
jgi:hypothetical protein